MPPQQTNLTSEPGRDAAGLRFDFAVASFKDILPETEAAGPSVALTRNVLRSLTRYWRAFRERRERNRLQASLRDLSDRQLIDIGLTPGDIDYIVAHRSFERLRDGTEYLWLSRGVM
jgi:uncharacterized protein YjiS (DUF1127 family)